MRSYFGIKRAALLILVAAAIWPAQRVWADTVTDAIAVVRGTYALDRQAYLSENLELTASESSAFWPVYRKYRVTVESLGDELVKLVLEYADIYPNLPQERARRLLKRYSAVEKKLASHKADYLKKFAKVLPADKALRFVQLENRMDLALRLQLASMIPVAPQAGKAKQ